MTNQDQYDVETQPTVPLRDDPIDPRFQRLFEQRGYIVLGTDECFEVGEVIHFVDWGSPNESNVKDTPVVVIAETTEDDFFAQNALLEPREWERGEWEHFYRVVAE